MKGLTGLSFETVDLDAFAIRERKQKGIFKRESIEEYSISRPFWNPFRLIQFLDENDCVLSTSLFDESNFSYITDENEHLLLWRPRYVGVDTKNVELATEEKQSVSDSRINDFVKIVLNNRNAAFDLSTELREQLHERQPSHRSTMSLLVPRTPSSLREVEEIDSKKRLADSWLKATSLLMNLKTTERPATFKIGEQVLVESIILHYQSLQGENDRIIVLESPISNNLDEAQVSGRPLTRLAFLNKQCFEELLNRAF